MTNLQRRFSGQPARKCLKKSKSRRASDAIHTEENKKKDNHRVIFADDMNRIRPFDWELPALNVSDPTYEMPNTEEDDEDDIRWYDDDSSEDGWEDYTRENATRGYTWNDVDVGEHAVYATDFDKKYSFVYVGESYDSDWDSSFSGLELVDDSDSEDYDESDDDDDEEGEIANGQLSPSRMMQLSLEGSAVEIDVEEAQEGDTGKSATTDTTTTTSMELPDAANKSRFDITATKTSGKSDTAPTRITRRTSDTHQNLAALKPTATSVDRQAVAPTEQADNANRPGTKNLPMPKRRVSNNNNHDDDDDDDSLNNYTWEQPDWAKSQKLRRTRQGRKVRQGASLAKPITHINRALNDEAEQKLISHLAWQKPDWVKRAVVRQTTPGRKAKLGQTLDKGITHINAQEHGLDWEKPSWTQINLKKTARGKKLAAKGTLEKPITFPKGK